MNSGNSRTWSIILGVLAILAGLMLLFWPGKSIGLIVVLVGLYALIHGFVMIGRGFFDFRKSTDRTWLILGGILSVLFGALILAMPGLSLYLLLVLIAARAFLVGIVEIISGFKWTHSTWLGVIGILNVLFAILLLFLPGATVVAIAWLVGIYLIFIGFLEIFEGPSPKSARPIEPA